MTYDRMVEIAKDHLDGELKWCNDTKLNEIFESVRAECGGSVNSVWIKLQQAISNDLVFEEEIWTHFTDEQLKKLFQKRLGFELETGNYKESLSSCSTIFHPAQNVLGRAVRLGYNQTLEYFMDYVNIEIVDLDRLMVLSAINVNNEKALELILKHADKKYKTDGGDHNAFFYKIKNEVNNTLAESKISDDLKQRLVSEFSWILPINKIDKLKEAWDKMSSSELLNVDTEELNEDETEIYAQCLENKLNHLKSRLADLEK